jgi:hypothetical protein
VTKIALIHISDSAALHAGDAVIPGQLTIAGTYSQLSGATLNVSIGGTTVGNSTARLKITARPVWEVRSLSV